MDRPACSHSILVGLVIALAIALGCAKPPRPPMPTDEEIALEKAIAEIDTVAIAPLRSAMVPIESAQVVAAFETRVTKRLESVGLRVVPPRVWDDLWRQFAGDVGRVFDQKTGQVDDERYAVVRDAVIRELIEKHSVEATLEIRVGSDVHYGVSRSFNSCGEPRVPYWPGGWHPATGARAMRVEIACLRVWLKDGNGKSLFGRQAPIEGIDTYYLQTRARRSPEETFQNPAELDHAVEVVLEPLSARSKAQPAP